MHISVVRLYHPAPWGWLYSYQAALISLRLLEQSFVVLKYLFIRAPFLMLWAGLVAGATLGAAAYDWINLTSLWFAAAAAVLLTLVFARIPE